MVLHANLGKLSEISADHGVEYSMMLCYQFSLEWKIKDVMMVLVRKLGLCAPELNGTSETEF